MQQENIIEEILPFKDKLYRYSLKILRNVNDAEDVVQELMIKLWKKRDQISQIDNKEAWCMTVTRNLSIDKIRKRKESNYDISDYHFISDRAATPDIVTEDRESLSIVMKIMDELPLKQKEIIHLRDVEGYSYSEIAKMTEYSEDQVKVKLFRARQKLRAKLKNFKY